MAVRLITWYWVWQAMWVHVHSRMLWWNDPFVHFFMLPLCVVLSLLITWYWLWQAMWVHVDSSMLWWNDPFVHFFIACPSFEGMRCVLNFPLNPTLWATYVHCKEIWTLKHSSIGGSLKPSTWIPLCGIMIGFWGTFTHSLKRGLMDCLAYSQFLNFFAYYCMYMDIPNSQ